MQERLDGKQILKENVGQHGAFSRINSPGQGIPANYTGLLHIMIVKDLLFMAYTRREPSYFFNRIVIGLAFAALAHYTGYADPKLIVQETKSKQLLLVSMTVFLCIFVFIIHRFHIRGKLASILHKSLFSFCKTCISVIRSAFIMSLAILIYCMGAEKDMTLIPSCISFLAAVEVMSYADVQWGKYGCDM